ncbi:MAG: hypothetical protein ACOYVD_02495 [Bacillota bacterium]
MFMFLDFNSSLVNTLFLIGYFLLLLYAFGKGREIRLKRKEKAFLKKLFAVLQTEELPLYKGQNKVNWSKVYTQLKNTPPSPQRDEVMEVVKNRKSGH